jgi:eukaryotic-like serine/threonine-protein kinase
MNKYLKSHILDIAIGIILACLASYTYYVQWTPAEFMELSIYDGRFKPHDKVSSAVVIVAIDDESIARLGSWPWPRSSIARMINLLNSYGSKVIGVSIIFSENNFNQGLLEVKNLIKKIEADPRLIKEKRFRKIYHFYSSLKDAEKKLDNETILSASIGESRKVVLPVDFILGSTIRSSGTEMPDYLKRNSYPLRDRLNSLTAREIILPMPDFANKALALGHINIVADKDGKVRSEPLLVSYQDRVFPSFGFQLALKYLNYDIKDLSILNGLTVGNINIPTYEQNKMRISFNRSFTYFPFHEVLSNKIPAEAFKDKIVIIAQNSTGLGVRHVTPMGSDVPSWRITANVINNILNNDHIVRPEWAFPFEVGVIVFFGIFLAMAIPMLKPGIGAIASLVLLLVWIGAAEYLWVHNGYWIKMVYPSALLIIGFIILAIKRHFFALKTRERIEEDSFETIKMLGLSFQGQGNLDMAFEKFRKCPIEDELVKDLFYNLGLDFERKRMFNKAVAVYEHIAQAGNYKDIEERIKRLKAAGDTIIFGLGGTKKNS